MARVLPARPNLEYLKNEAKDLLIDMQQSNPQAQLADAQFALARDYGFASWPKLKAHVESLEEVGQLKQAIDGNDIERLKTMMRRNPTLHRAPIGYGKDSPLTWVAECRVPRESPSPTRLAMARWMIENGSDVHQGGDGPLMRAALALPLKPAGGTTRLMDISTWLGAGEGAACTRSARRHVYTYRREAAESTMMRRTIAVWILASAAMFVAVPEFCTVNV